MATKIKSHPGSYKITRALDKYGFLKTLGILNTQTFVLGSQAYYEELENKGDGRGDKYENTIVQMKGAIKTFDTNCDPIYITSWSMGNEINTMFGLFEDNAAVVETTIDNLEKIIESQIIPHIEKSIIEKIGFKYQNPVMRTRTGHGAVLYYDVEHGDIINDDVESINSYCKRMKFSKENEYRYLITLNSQTVTLPQRWVIELNQTNYIKKVYLKRNMFTENELDIIKSHCDSYEIELLFFELHN